MYEGYLPTKEIFLEGGYEASSSMFHDTLEEECFGAAMGLIDTLYGK